MKLELVLFNDALTHLMRITRILAMARGSALLVGVGGSGKQSLARLAAYIAGAYAFQITITKTYSITNLFEDIKALYKIAGFKGQPVAFIFTDAGRSAGGGGVMCCIEQECGKEQGGVARRCKRGIEE